MQKLTIKTTIQLTINADDDCTLDDVMENVGIVFDDLPSHNARSSEIEDIEILDHEIMDIR